ncbi:MAG: ferrous iron transport protein A [Anaerolineales bacterium]|nr:ferrous iron transport protein A [Anaerolineales bacterium]
MTLLRPTFLFPPKQPIASPTPPHEMTLDRAPVGQTLQLKRFNTSEAVTRRLVELGLTPHVSLRLVQDSGGPLILAVRGSRIALGRDMARQVIVRTVSHE